MLLDDAVDAHDDPEHCPSGDHNSVQGVSLRALGESGSRRGGGRAARQAARASAAAQTAAYLERRLPPVEVLDEAGLVQIEENAETILSEVGVAFQEFPEALELWKASVLGPLGLVVWFSLASLKGIQGFLWDAIHLDAGEGTVETLEGFRGVSLFQY